MTENTWIIVAGEPGIKNLVETARGLGGHVRALVVGDRAVAESVAASDVDEVTWIECQDDVPLEAYGVVVRDLISAAPGILIGGRRPAERALLGAAAAGLGAPVFTGVSSVTTEVGEVVVTYLAYGGISEQTVVISGPVALVFDGGGVPEAGSPATIKVAEAEPAVGVTLVEKTVSEAEHADLGSASRVVGVGRGLKKQEDLSLIEELARTLRAEIGCTRPLAEGLDWLPKDRYIGISGQHIAPRLYLVVGASGQLQHIDGVRGADLIVSINTDSEAPIVEQSDYVLTGDLYELVPALTAALSGT